MSTIYIIQPDDDARKDAINALMDSLDKLYPDEIITHQAIAIKTEIPAVIQLLTSLVSPVQATHPSTLGPLTEAGAPPSPDEKPKARRQPPASQAAAKGGSYKRKEKPDPGGSAAPVAGPSSFPAASVKDLLDELDAQAHQLAPAGDPAAEEAREKKCFGLPSRTVENPGLRQGAIRSPLRPEEPQAGPRRPGAQQNTRPVRSDREDQWPGPDPAPAGVVS